jgi:hypothetical protein
MQAADDELKLYGQSEPEAPNTPLTQFSASRSPRLAESTGQCQLADRIPVPMRTIVGTQPPQYKDSK